MNVYLCILMLFLSQIVIVALIGKRQLILRLSSKIYWRVIWGKCFLIFDFIILLILAALRDESVGKDYFNYISIIKGFLNLDYDNIMNNSYAEKAEVSFVLLGYLLKNIFNEYIYIVFVIYFVMLFFVYRFIKKYADDVLLSGFLFFGFSFYNMSLNIMRQYIAAAIILKAVDYIDKDFKKFILFVVIAMTFHKTAFIFVIIYPALKYVKNIRTSCVVLLFICGVIALFSEQLIVMVGDVAHYSAKYVTAGDEAEIDLKFFVNVIMFATFFINYKQFADWDKNANKWLAMSAVTLGLNFSALYFHYINRVFLYFMLPQIVSIPNFINSFDSENTRMGLRGLLILIVSAYYLVLIYNTQCYGTVPYTSEILDIRE